MEQRNGVGEPTCAELFCDGVDQAVDLFKAKDDVVTIGEVTIFLLAMAVFLNRHCQQEYQEFNSTWPDNGYDK